ncbi:uncharacterized protein UV8b_03594 [Ustilaginoidea virens]|uniref:Sec1 family superfamily n=1 Tax=Ustilaginoidea virens TaxID=1159556 RepID=A0A8E5MGB1_USTVR|nr:uncharacterized protein UV8b_03594 [Ustilaginoidea virens]QUC19353.1 hypothetical protein UV8b_03594 [Ustilaginoidea virens]
MGLSVLQEQHDIILQEIRNITQGDWKCLVVDEASRKIIDNVVKDDEILNTNIATIERIEERREPNPDMDAIYLLSAEPHIVDCLLADFERRRYRRGYLVWTSLLEPGLRRKMDEFPGIRQLRASSKTLFVNFYPKESHLITFRDPWSFPILYHPACNNLIPKHMQALAQKIAGVCITLGEYPKVRYYRPDKAFHEASVLCSHLARFVQEELDGYAHWNPDFPPPSNRPQSTLIVTDRSMDLMAPLLHEFTYQAMAHDLLSIKDGDRVTFRTKINAGTAEEQEKDMELSDKDKIWVENRHRHMKDTIDKLMGDFQKFLDQNPHFTNDSRDATSLNAIRDMLAGLPQFQEMKEAYSLHLTMAQECMNIFQRNKLPDLASIEQTMSTGSDEDFRKPKNVLETIVRLLDDGAITPPDRLRLIVMYVLYRGGVIAEDVQKLLIHASLPPQDGEVVANLELLGGKTSHVLKEPRQPPPPLFPRDRDPRSAQATEEYALSRYEPTLKSMLDALTRGALDQAVFPHVKPPMDPNEDLLVAQGGSLRAGRPNWNWAAAGRRPPENRQRIIVFMAGGATYSESRACYEVSRDKGRDVILATSHMLTPQLFVRQVTDLSRDKRQLDIPMERPKPRAPAHLLERPAPPPQPAAAAQPYPPGGDTSDTSLGGRGPRMPPSNAGPGARLPRQGGLAVQPISGPHPVRGPSSAPAAPPSELLSKLHLNPSPASQAASSGGAPSQDGGKAHKDKKRRNFLGMKK